MPARIASLMEEHKKTGTRSVGGAQEAGDGWRGVGFHGSAAASGVREVGNTRLMARAVEGIEMKDLKSLVDDGKKRSAPAWSPSLPSAGTARPESSSASPAT